MNAISDVSPPSRKRGIRPIPRRPDFSFSEATVPPRWFAGDAGLSAAWGALSVIAAVYERVFVASGKDLLEAIDDPLIADETGRFMQQEAIHSAQHARLNRVFASRGLPVARVERFVDELAAELEARAAREVFLAAGLGGEQLIGELGHAVLERPEVLEGVAEPVRRLFLWHFFEEVEHQASLHEGWVHVYGDDSQARAQRVLGAFYVFVITAAAWPVAAWAMLEDDARDESGVWDAALAQLFGVEGLMRGVADNLRNVARVAFHPFDMHDPVPTLEKYRDDIVSPAWEIPAKSSAPARQRVERSVEPVGFTAVGEALGYVGWAARHAWRFVRAERARRENTRS